MKKNIMILAIVGAFSFMAVQARFIAPEQEEQLKRKEKITDFQAREAESRAKRDQKLAKTNADARYKKAKIETEHDKNIAELERSRGIEAEKMRNVRYPSDYAAINNAMQTSDTRIFR